MSARPRALWAHPVAALRRHGRGLPPTVRALWWSATAGLLFVVLNTIMRRLSMQMDPFETQFLRYLGGFLVMLPLIARTGAAAFWPRSVGGQFVRGVVHTGGLCVWFLALPHIGLAETTAIGFTTPIFIMVGAVLVLGERMRWERWVAAAIGFAGVLVVVGPHLAGAGSPYTLVMLGSSPLFAASFLITKALTRYERPEVIVTWQSITVTLCSLPLALWHWTWPTPLQWALALLCGLLGSTAHYCLTRSFGAADISATQSLKFLDLVWATLLGWLAFGDVPAGWTIAGGVVICASTVWIARREARGRAVSPS